MVIASFLTDGTIKSMSHEPFKTLSCPSAVQQNYQRRNENSNNTCNVKVSNDNLSSHHQPLYNKSPKNNNCNSMPNPFPFPYHPAAMFMMPPPLGNLSTLMQENMVGALNKPPTATNNTTNNYFSNMEINGAVNETLDMRAANNSTTLNKPPKLSNQHSFYEDNTNMSVKRNLNAPPQANGSTNCTSGAGWPFNAEPAVLASMMEAGSGGVLPKYPIIDGLVNALMMGNGGSTGPNCPDNLVDTNTMNGDGKDSGGVLLSNLEQKQKLLNALRLQQQQQQALLLQQQQQQQNLLLSSFMYPHLFQHNNNNNGIMNPMMKNTQLSTNATQNNDDVERNKANTLKETSCGSNITKLNAQTTRAMSTTSSMNYAAGHPSMMMMAMTSNSNSLPFPIPPHMLPIIGNYGNNNNNANTQNSLLPPNNHTVINNNNIPFPHPSLMMNHPSMLLAAAAAASSFVNGQNLGTFPIVGNQTSNLLGGNNDIPHLPISSCSKNLKDMGQIGNLTPPSSLLTPTPTPIPPIGQTISAQGVAHPKSMNKYANNGNENILGRPDLLLQHQLLMSYLNNQAAQSNHNNTNGPMGFPENPASIDPLLIPYLQFLEQQQQMAALASQNAPNANVSNQYNNSMSLGPIKTSSSQKWMNDANPNNTSLNNPKLLHNNLDIHKKGMNQNVTTPINSTIHNGVGTIANTSASAVSGSQHNLQIAPHPFFAIPPFAPPLFSSSNTIVSQMFWPLNISSSITSFPDFAPETKGAASLQHNKGVKRSITPMAKTNNNKNVKNSSNHLTPNNNNTTCNNNKMLLKNCGPNRKQIFEEASELNHYNPARGKNIANRTMSNTSIVKTVSGTFSLGPITTSTQNSMMVEENKYSFLKNSIISDIQKLDSHIDALESRITFLTQTKAEISKQLEDKCMMPVSNHQSPNNFYESSVSDAPFLDSLHQDRIVKENELKLYQHDLEKHLIPISSICNSNKNSAQLSGNKHILYTGGSHGQHSQISMINYCDIRFNDVKTQHIRSYLSQALSQKLRSTYVSHKRFVTAYKLAKENWIEGVSKANKIAKRRNRDAKAREFFESQYPELRDDRLERERLKRVWTRNTMGNYARTETDVEEISKRLLEQEEEKKRLYNLSARIPCLLTPADKANERRYVYIDSLRIVETPVTSPIVQNIANNANIPRILRQNCPGYITPLQAKLIRNAHFSVWNAEEREIFKRAYATAPKEFDSISKACHKPVSECVRFYYLTKKRENYKKVLKRRMVKKRKVVSNNSNNSGTTNNVTNTNTSSTIVTNITTTSSINDTISTFQTQSQPPPLTIDNTLNTNNNSNNNLQTFKDTITTFDNLEKTEKNNDKTFMTSTIETLIPTPILIEPQTTVGTDSKNVVVTLTQTVKHSNTNQNELNKDALNIPFYGSVISSTDEQLITDEKMGHVDAAESNTAERLFPHANQKNGLKNQRPKSEPRLHETQQQDELFGTNNTVIINKVKTDVSKSQTVGTCFPLSGDKPFVMGGNTNNIVETSNINKEQSKSNLSKTQNEQPIMIKDDPYEFPSTDEIVKTQSPPISVVAKRLKSASSAAVPHENTLDEIKQGTLGIKNSMGAAAVTNNSVITTVTSSTPTLGTNKVLTKDTVAEHFSKSLLIATNSNNITLRNAISVKPTCSPPTSLTSQITKESLATNSVQSATIQAFLAALPKDSNEIVALNTCSNPYLQKSNSLPSHQISASMSDHTNHHGVVVMDQTAFTKPNNNNTNINNNNPHHTATANPSSNGFSHFFTNFITQSNTFTTLANQSSNPLIISSSSVINNNGGGGTTPTKIDILNAVIAHQISQTVPNAESIELWNPIKHGIIQPILPPPLYNTKTTKVTHENYKSPSQQANTTTIDAANNYYTHFLPPLKNITPCTSTIDYVAKKDFDVVASTLIPLSTCDNNPTNHKPTPEQTSLPNDVLTNVIITSTKNMINEQEKAKA